jgi:glycosyltransferase involved in cell wall biosynthesis
MKHNILEITPNFGFARGFIGSRFDYMQKLGYDMHLICSPHEDFDSFVRSQHIRGMAIDIPRLPNLVKDAKAIIAIVKYIRRNHIDCVVGHADKGKLLGAIVSRLTQTKFVVFAHGTPLCFRQTGFKKWIFTRVEKFDTQKASKTICVNRFVAEARALHNLDKDGMQAIPNKGSCGGLDCMGQFNLANLPNNMRATQRKKFGFGENDFVIGFCGRFTHDKGIDELIPAFMKLKEQGDIPAKLVMIGSKDIRDAIKEETSRLMTTNPDIIQTGYINHSEIQNIYSTFDVFVLPTYREGFPYVVLESQSMEVPVLTTADTGSRDSIVDGVTGEYIKRECDDIVQKLAKLYNLPDYRLKLGRQAREWICDNFENKTVWNAIIDIYNSVLNKDKQ